MVTKPKIVQWAVVLWVEYVLVMRKVKGEIPDWFKLRERLHHSLKLWWADERLRLNNTSNLDADGLQSVSAEARRWWGQNMARAAWIHGTKLPCINGPGWWWVSDVGNFFFFGHTLGLLIVITIWKQHLEYCCWPCAFHYNHNLPDLSIKPDIAQRHHTKLHYINELSLLAFPDLNPIENLWDVMEQEICSINVQLKKLQILCDSHVNMRPNLERSVSNILQSPCSEDFRLFWEQVLV